MAYFDTSYVQQTNIGAYVAGLSSYYTHRLAKFYIRLPDGNYGSSYDSNLIGTNDSSSNVVNIGGLQPGTAYILRADIVNYYDHNNILFSDTMYVTTDSPPQNPYSWSWNATEQNALYYKGKTTAILGSRWNEFVEQVRKTSVWYHGYDPYYCTEALVTSSDKNITAYRFNTLRIAIGSMNVNGSGLDPSWIQPGKVVMGNYFIELSKNYNSITKPTSYSLGTYEQIHNIDLLHTIAKIEDLNRSRRRD
ncbi:MAG: hypothetical protein ACRCX8_16455 [Sarcina sp.]